MNLENKTNNRAGERGNVLFLILIAVALFAALSYAVTQSTRSGSNDAGGEKSLISSAQVTQYPSGIRTSLVRMVIGGTSADQLLFNAPSDFVCPATTTLICDTDADETDETYAVFHPSGGGSPYQLAQPEILSGATQQKWVFTSAWEVEQIGTSSAGSGDGNEIIAFLPNISASICRKLNTEYGLPVAGGTDADGDGIPKGSVNDIVPDPTDSAHIMEKGETGASFSAELDRINETPFIGQPFGCYDTSDGNGTPGDGPFVYYHVLIER